MSASAEQFLNQSLLWSDWQHPTGIMVLTSLIPDDWFAIALLAHRLLQTRPDTPVLFVVGESQRRKVELMRRGATLLGFRNFTVVEGAANDDLYPAQAFELFGVGPRLAVQPPSIVPPETLAAMIEFAERLRDVLIVSLKGANELLLAATQSDRAAAAFRRCLVAALETELLPSGWRAPIASSIINKSFRGVLVLREKRGEFDREWVDRVLALRASMPDDSGLFWRALLEFESVWSQSQAAAALDKIAGSALRAKQDFSKLGTLKDTLCRDAEQLARFATGPRRPVTLKRASLMAFLLGDFGFLGEGRASNFYQLPLPQYLRFAQTGHAVPFPATSANDAPPTVMFVFDSEQSFAIESALIEQLSSVAEVDRAAGILVGLGRRN